MRPLRWTAFATVLLMALPVMAADPQEKPAPLPGDNMIDDYLARLTAEMDNSFPADVKSADDWAQQRPSYLREYYYMLGLDPMPERTPLNPTVTGTLTGQGCLVDKLHYQSSPRLYVTANLYRPASVKAGQRLPAVLYVCGHSNMGRNGNKTAYQAWGPWFARHGYVCLMVDSLQLGEIAAIHHGTYREGRWWWHSRGYTPAGVECWNGIRGIDYLVSRPDVDPERIAVTGISGGAATWWIAAADPRVRVAVPVSGMSDLTDYVTGHIVDGHCDCMFMYNTYAWPWTRIAALIAPRPLFFVNSDHDDIFPMTGNERISNRLERFYALFGAGERFETLVSVGGHAYRQDIRQAVYRFLNMCLQSDCRPVTDSEVDLVTGEGQGHKYPMDPERLRVFPRDEDLPKDQLNTTIDEHFVPVAALPPPSAGQFADWQKTLVAGLRSASFRHFPEHVPSAVPEENLAGQVVRCASEKGISFYLKSPASTQEGRPQLLVLAGPEGLDQEPPWLDRVRPANDLFLCETRGHGRTKWSAQSPPNRVARSHVLLGRTIDAGRVWDAAAAAVMLSHRGTVHIAGEGGQGIIAAYAVLLEPQIQAITLVNPAMTHMDKNAPAMLNVLRVGDIPDVLGALAPRPLTLIGVQGEGVDKVRKIYQAAGAADQLRIE